MGTAFVAFALTLGNDESCVPPGCSTAIWRLNRRAIDADAREHPRDHRVRVPHFAGAEFIAAPNRGGYRRQDSKDSSRQNDIVAQPHGARERFANVGDPILRASVGSRSGSTANGLPFAFQLHPRRRRLADRHGGLGRVPARSRSGLLERGPPGPSGRGRVVLAVARARKAPRTAGRSNGRRARRHPTGSSRDQPIRVVGLRRGSLNQRTTKRVLRGRAVSPRSQFAHGSSAQSPRRRIVQMRAGCELARGASARGDDEDLWRRR